MELKYVGPMPVVSDRGIGFDQTKPDKFTFLNAAVELLEALSFGPTETTKHLHKTNTEEYSADELLVIVRLCIQYFQHLFKNL